MSRLSKFFLTGLLLLSLQSVMADDFRYRPEANGNLSPKNVRTHQVATPADTGFNENVFSVGIYDGDLIVGGQFSTAVGIFALKIIGWNGSNWYDLNIIPAGNTVYDLLEFNGKLYTGYSIARMNEWDGSSWTELMPRLVDGFSHPIYAVAAYDGALIAGGSWVSDNGAPDYIARWNGAGWDSLGTGITGQVRELIEYDNMLIAGGFFTTGDGSAGDRIAAWNGTSWSPLGSGMSDGGVYVMAVFNGDLIAAGTFTMAGGNNANRIARWNGVNWQPLGAGFDDAVVALTVHNGNLIAGGSFQNSGTTSTPWVASWDGSSWSPVGTEMDGRVEGLTVYNGWLVAGGRFDTAGGGKVALWDGLNWRPVGDFATDVESDQNTDLPADYTLRQNYPNPFNPTTTVDYDLSHSAHVNITVFNMLGQQVRLLVQEQKAAGSYSTTWDGTDDLGKPVSTGVYMYRIQADGYVETRKMVLVK